MKSLLLKAPVNLPCGLPWKKQITVGVAKAEYCCYDVKLTKLVHEYGQRHRQLHYHNRFGKKMTVPVSW